MMYVTVRNVTRLTFLVTKNYTRAIKKYQYVLDFNSKKTFTTLGLRYVKRGTSNVGVPFDQTINKLQKQTSPTMEIRLIRKYLLVLVILILYNDYHCQKCGTPNIGSACDHPLLPLTTANTDV